MMKGKVNAALKMLTDSHIGVHQANEEVLSTLREKHPHPSPITENTLLNGPVNSVLPCYFDSIAETMIYKAASLTKGAGGPSQLDAEQYRHILTIRKYKAENKDLREQMAQLARKLASEELDPSILEAYRL